MKRKRYGIVLPEDIYREWRLRAVQANMSVGDWVAEKMRDRGINGEFEVSDSPSTFGVVNMPEESTPAEVAVVSETVRPMLNIKEHAVEEPVKKSLEIDKARPDNKGGMRKGLGPLPGEPDPGNGTTTFGRSRPAPKPGKK